MGAGTSEREGTGRGGEKAKGVSAATAPPPPVKDENINSPPRGGTGGSREKRKKIESEIPKLESRYFRERLKHLKKRRVIKDLLQTRNVKVCN